MPAAPVTVAVAVAVAVTGLSRTGRAAATTGGARFVALGDGPVRPADCDRVVESAPDCDGDSDAAADADADADTDAVGSAVCVDVCTVDVGVPVPVSRAVAVAEFLVAPSDAVAVPDAPRGALTDADDDVRGRESDAETAPDGDRVGRGDTVSVRDVVCVRVMAVGAADADSVA